MSDFIIQTKSLAKRYKRFSSQGWRALDALGFPVSSKRYSDFDALSDINVTIGRGERVALVGRNGAGKSTLLRIISGQQQASSGSVYVGGRVHALMELGAGFHPDFTGRENIRSALAFSGVVNGIPEKTREIIEFTELEEFIDRPVREYSAGMYSRLAFAVATSTQPEILIVDEILGAGDSYFVGKCIQRMKDITANGTTVLFVSHDMSAVQMLCDRAIWIHSGSVRADGPTLDISKKYLRHIREEEEIRLAAKASSIALTSARKIKSGSAFQTLFRLVVPGNPSLAPKDACSVFGISASIDGQAISSWSASSAEENKGIEVLDDPKLMNWRIGKEKKSHPVVFKDWGGEYGHAPFVVFHGEPLSTMDITLSCRYSGEEQIQIEVFNNEINEYQEIGHLESRDEVGEFSFRVERESSQEEAPDQAEQVESSDEEGANDSYGSGELKIERFGFIDEDDQSRHTIYSGAPVRARFEYFAAEQVHRPIPVLAVYRPDGTCAMQIVGIETGISLDKVEGRGMVDVIFDPLYLGPGDYMCSVAFFVEMDPVDPKEPKAYDLHDRCYPLKVLPPHGYNLEIGTVNQPVSWTMEVVK